MHIRSCLAALVLMTCAAHHPAHALNDLDRDLVKYNQLKLSRDAQFVDATDNGDVAAFRGYQFECRKQEDYSPDETPAARAALDKFLAYFAAHPSPNVAQKKERIALLEAAIKAGSWRADYIDVIWGIWDNRGNPREAQPYADRLGKFVDTGVPIAVHGFLEWTGGQYEHREQRTYLLKAAIERGNPQTMSSVGYNLGTHTFDLRPMAKQMLDCAAAQGDPDAYNGIGRIAWHEGRWVDAYRAWATGANLGCDDCLGQIEELVTLRPGHRVSDGSYDTDPGFKALRRFYADQFLYGITHMTELRVTAPPAVQVQVSDAQIVQIIKARLARYGTP